MILKDIVRVRYLDGYSLHVCFEDGIEGEIDVSELVQFTGVFARLEDTGFLAQVRVDPDLGTICWPNGADLDPDVLYSVITGEPISLSQPMNV